MKIAFHDVTEMFELEAEFETRDHINGRVEKPLGKGNKKKQHVSSVPQEILDLWKKWVWDLLGQGVDKPDEIIKRIHRQHHIRIPNTTVNAFIAAYKSRGLSKKRPQAPSGEERKRRAELLAGFSLLTQPIWTDEGEQPVRSRFNEMTRVLQVNNAHPDYLALTREMEVKKRENPAPLYRYIAELVAKELTPLYYSFISDQSELFDRFLDIRNGVWGRLNLLN